MLSAVVPFVAVSELCGYVINVSASFRHGLVSQPLCDALLVSS